MDRASDGLSSAQAVDLSGPPFALTCMHRPSSIALIIVEPGSEDVADPLDYKYMRIGVPTTTACSTSGSTARENSASAGPPRLGQAAPQAVAPAFYFSHCVRRSRRPGYEYGHDYDGD